MTYDQFGSAHQAWTLEAAAARAARAIPPAWPLAASVAVNPFLGQTHETLETVAARLGRVSVASVTMPRSWYADQIVSNVIQDVDLAEALAATPSVEPNLDLAAFRAAALTEPLKPSPLPTIADLAAKVSGIDWPGLIAERFGAWAAGYLDEGHAPWAAPDAPNAYAAWRSVATHDLAPEIIGLAGFAAHVAVMPAGAAETIAQVARRLWLPAEALDTYFHQLLLTLGGWAQYARYRLWQAELRHGDDATITDFLAVRLVWEAALYQQYKSQIANEWTVILAAHSRPVVATSDQVIDTILQAAYERAAQRRLAGLLAAPALPATFCERPRFQMAFCIDVRSEVFRRALESLDPDIQTLGFAGFFGLATSHRSFASDVSELRLPVLLTPGVTSVAGSWAEAPADQAARYKARAERAWGRFKAAAVSSFAFVEAAGPLYLGKLLCDASGARSKGKVVDPEPRFEPALDLAKRVEIAGNILKAMSLTARFARLVVLAGHGAQTMNNPHASSLNCGACGGYSGEVNARLLATLLNDEEVRYELAVQGVAIPDDTVFIAALHDTTTDAVTLYAESHERGDHALDLDQARTWLSAAGALARAERALQLPRAHDHQSVVRRSKDWAEVRPEWGLAGCEAFIAAPRRRTQGKALGGRAFLHDYDWRTDKGFAVLELILTAPVVVASWISLQYYGSTVAPEIFGAGNKLLHNVVGGIGVVEGNGGTMRVGLPWQSVHDGEKLVHDPVRLSVCIEAPRDAIAHILSRHPGVKALFDNQWLHLFALDDDGHMASRYVGELGWTPDTRLLQPAA